MNDDRLGPSSHLFDRALELVKRRDGSAQFVVVHKGQTVLDHSQGHDADALYWSFSVSKAYIAILIHLLAQRQVVDLDRPVAEYWPEFARHRKNTITIRNVLQHRSGFATVHGFALDALMMTDWKRSIQALERVTPRWPASTVPAYQVFAFGFILGEIIERVTGGTIKEVLESEILAPANLHDTYLGLPPGTLDRAVPLTGQSLGGCVVSAALNRDSVRRAVIPSAGISTTARDLAGFYSILLRNGRTQDGTQLIPAQAIESALQPSSRNQRDNFAKEHIAWGNGFQLGGRTSNPLPPLGRKSGPRTFGHNGSNICVGWADPDNDLVMAYVTNQVTNDSQLHITRVSDAVHDAVV